MIEPSVYLTIPPNWLEKVKVGRSWNTTILTSLDGSEQRSSNFTWSRLRTSFKVSAAEYNQLAWLNANLFLYQDKVWGVPIWTDGVMITSLASSGQKIINVQDTTKCRFSLARKIIIIDFSDFKLYEAKYLSLIEANKFTCVVNLVDSWPVGCWVYPCIDSVLRTDVSGEVITDIDLDIDIEADEGLVGSY